MRSPISEASLFQIAVEAPFGFVLLQATATEMVSVDILENAVPTSEEVPLVLREASRQIKAYLKSPHCRFELSLRQRGTDYQRRVWAELCAIPVSTVKSYGQLASDMASGPRAIAMACRANDFPIIIPCHRVVASNGLGGYAGERQGRNIEIKKWLLQHEGVSIA